MFATTIAAVSSPPGPARRGVIRVSGPRAREVVERATRLDGGARPGPRAALTGRLLDGRGEQPLLLLWMPGPHSYTREDVAELHLPGSPWLLDAALERLLELGVEPARPGEFTRRAFESGRIDLFAAEGVLELIQASNEVERRAAAGLLFGGLGGRVAALRDGLEELRALCEASLDFDEDDAGHVPAAELARAGGELRSRIDEALAWERRREPMEDLPRIVLGGLPNAGKSSLFNRLCPDGAALVSDLAGTTRDPVAGIWTVAGRPCRLLDTAGLDARAADREPDRLAQDEARAAARAADLVLELVDPSGPSGASADGGQPEGNRLRVWTKADRSSPRTPPAGEPWVSTLDGRGLPELEREVANRLGLEGHAPGARSEASDGRALGLRHRHALAIARDELVGALELLAEGAPLDLVAAGFKRSTDALDGISGRTTPEDLLDRIFARFCLGK